MTHIKEKEWFARHPHYKDIQHLCGIERLMESMISLLANKMIDEIPRLVREMKERKIKVRKVQDRSCSKSFLSSFPRSFLIKLSLVQSLPIEVFSFFNAQSQKFTQKHILSAIVRHMKRIRNLHSL